MEVTPEKYKAPEIYGNYWFNSEPVLISAQKGLVVLIDFWDSTCPKCLNGIPYLKEWLKRYSEIGFINIGVITPKFPFEKDPLFIEKILRNFDISYPVVMDNELFIKTAYKVRINPTRVLVDKSGYIRYIQEGEGGYGALESSIQSLLKDAGYFGDFPYIMEPIRVEDHPGITFYHTTPEILVGYQRNNIGNTEGYFPLAVHNYSDPNVYLEGRIYLHGKWFINKYFVKLEADEGETGYIAFIYKAKEVGVVLQPDKVKRFIVFVYQDNEFLTKDNAGRDIKFDEMGRSYVVVEEPKLFSIIINIEHSEHLVKLVSNSNGFLFFGATFIPAPIQELV